jgi:hypothetical protein
MIYHLVSVIYKRVPAVRILMLSNEAAIMPFFLVAPSGNIGGGTQCRDNSVVSCCFLMPDLFPPHTWLLSIPATIPAKEEGVERKTVTLLTVGLHLTIITTAADNAGLEKYPFIL